MPVPSAALTLPAPPTVQQLYDELREEFQLLRNELRQEQQEILARVTALELRTLTGKRNSHSVWRAGSDGSEASPKSKGSRPKSIWKTSTDPLTPQSHMTSDTNGPNGPNGPNENRQAHEAETNELQATDTNLQIDMPADTVNEAAVFDDGLEEVEVHFEDSAWSIPMVLGLVDAGRFDTGYAVLLLLVNCGMQVMFSGILLSDGFMGEDFSEEKENAEIWRTSVAHDYKYMDLAQTSLVTRVCSGDGALILSTVQATLVRQINSYLGFPTGDGANFELPTFQPGLLLCVLCILLWSLCVYKEFRGISLSLAAACQIPRAKKTVFKEGTFYRISFGRFGLLLFTYFTRLAVATVLLLAGISWLARTTSISELMLNAVALNAILDVDEFLFLGLTPMKFQHGIQSLAPLTVTHSRRRSQWESSVQCLMLFCTMWLPFGLLLRPLSKTMLEVKETLCGGNQAFVIFHNAETQLTYGLMTSQDRGLGNLSVSELAVQDWKFSSEPMPGYILFSASEELFEVERVRSMTEIGSSLPMCLETEVLFDGGSLRNDSNIYESVLLFLRSAGAAMGLEGASSCSELSHLCDHHNARLLRYTCGHTCGCTDPAASPWYKLPNQGCAPTCTWRATMLRNQQPCEDVSANHSSWQKFWLDYASVLSGHFGTDITRASVWPGINLTIQVMLRTGCASLLQSPTDFLTQATWCLGDDESFGHS
ncbi:unnamed protein product, partial [Cladocopium goreaui]